MRLTVLNPDRKGRGAGRGQARSDALSALQLTVRVSCFDDQGVRKSNRGFGTASLSIF